MPLSANVTPSESALPDETYWNITAKDIMVSLLVALGGAALIGLEREHPGDSTGAIAIAQFTFSR
jgi:hypothetical protein